MCSDHPRIRGEHVTLQVIFPAIFGSSPHTRGAPVVLPVRGPAIGIIPAYAGSTTSTRRPPTPCRDHPRIRGEHRFWGRFLDCLAGSSPHTRGALARRAGPGCRRRIIPAYAGSTRGGLFMFSGGGDHPRIRGEHIKSGFGAIKDGGSSPHTRGARSEERIGVIPGLDHPRIRGEHHETETSSPYFLWIIPAYAGSTARRRE